VIISNIAQQLDLSKQIISNVLAVESAAGCPLTLKAPNGYKIEIACGDGIDLMGRDLCNVLNISAPPGQKISVTDGIGIDLIGRDLCNVGNISSFNNNTINITGNIDMNCFVIANIATIRANLWLGKNSPFFVGDLMNFINGTIGDIGINMNDRSIDAVNNIQTSNLNTAPFAPNMNGTSTGDVIRWSGSQWGPAAQTVTTLASSGGVSMVSDSTGPTLGIKGLSQGGGILLNDLGSSISISLDATSTTVSARWYHFEITNITPFYGETFLFQNNLIGLQINYPGGASIKTVQAFGGIGPGPGYLGIIRNIDTKTLGGPYFYYLPSQFRPLIPTNINALINCSGLIFSGTMENYPSGEIRFSNNGNSFLCVNPGGEGFVTITLSFQTA
jgi:hypothetical protein